MKKHKYQLIKDLWSILFAFLIVLIVHGCKKPEEKEVLNPYQVIDSYGQEQGKRVKKSKPKLDPSQFLKKTIKPKSKITYDINLKKGTYNIFTSVDHGFIYWTLNSQDKVLYTEDSELNPHFFQFFLIKETKQYQVKVENLHDEAIDFIIEFAPCWPQYQWVDDMDY